MTLFRLQSLLLLAATFLLLWGTPVSSKVCNPDADPVYMAAVVEYSPALGVTTENARERFQENVAFFANAAAIAKKEGAEIVVFPECGLVTLELPRRPDGSPLVALELPSIGANPCTEDNEYYSEELRALSCAARHNSIYAAVNLPEEERGENGSLYYNTDVAFDREGAIVARYRKYNLYGEDGFVPPSEPSLVYFDSDFGARFGLFTCFDLMFETPAVVLVTDAGVTDVIFPTAWFSELPFLTAVQAQTSWSRALDVNFLGAGYNLPEVGSTGSGIYAGRQGVVAATMERQRTSQLLVGWLPNRNACSAKIPAQKELTGRVVPLLRQDELTIAQMAMDEGVAHALYHDVSSKQTQNYFQSFASSFARSEQKVRGSWAGNLYLKTEELTKYATLLLNDTQESEDISNLNVCHGEFCCQFQVDVKIRTSSGFAGDEKDEESRYFYRLFAFSGLRSFDGIVDGGLEVCGIVACTDTTLDSCGQLHGGDVDLSLVSFRKVKIHGNFHRQHALALPSTLDASLLPLDEEAFAFSVTPNGTNEAHIVMESSTPISFLTFGVYSRDFANDP